MGSLLSTPAQDTCPDHCNPQVAAAALLTRYVLLYSVYGFDTLLLNSGLHEVAANSSSAIFHGD